MSSPESYTPLFGAAPRPVPGSLVALFILLYVVSQGHIAWMLLPLQPHPVLLQLTANPEAFAQILRDWGPAGQALYHSHFLFDTLHPFIYGTLGLLASRLALFASWSARSRRDLGLLLPLAGLLDLLENACHLIILAQVTASAGLPDLLVLFSAICSWLKWVFSGFFLLIVLVQSLRLLWSLRQARVQA